TGCDIHLMQEEDAVTMGAAISGAVASGAWGDFTSACKAMVEAGEIIQVNPQRREFLERKYRVYLTPWEQQHAVNQQMQY
ncbi:sugar kinase, partial [Escherichia coli]|nr:sugar kinase [Escherichia coli]